MTTLQQGWSELPPVAQRFLRYVQIDTQSDPSSKSTPSTEKQKNLSRLLAQELQDLGATHAEMDSHGYVYAELPAHEDHSGVSLALFAHVDTSPDEPGGPVQPQVHRAYDGSVIELVGDPETKLDPQRSPQLLQHIGHDIISSDGTTLLGSDDKAGVAIIMQVVADLLATPGSPRPRVAVCFTVDEEIGRGADKVDLERLAADVGYTVDGGPIGEVDTATFNAAEARIEVRGQMVHPGTAKGIMVNALSILAELTTSLPDAETPQNTAGDEGFFCIYSLSGDIAQAEARLLLRDFETAGLERRKELVHHLASAARTKYPGAEISVEIKDSYKNMRPFLLAGEPRSISLALAAARELGLDAKEAAVRGGTDGARLSELGLPTPNLFTGGHDYHSRFEWNTVQNLELSRRFLQGLLAAWARSDR